LGRKKERKNMHVDLEIKEGKRNFIVTLSAKETLIILESPAGMNFSHTKTDTHFAIYPTDFLPKNPEDLVFEYIGHMGQYIFTSKRGFTTNDEHLEWLVGLGSIKMGERSNTFGEERFVHMGFVTFKKPA
jgi:hypothetical protein